MDKKKNLSEFQNDTIPSGEDFTIGLVQSEWNPEITDALAQGAFECLTAHGVEADNVHHITVPGSFELPMGAKSLLGKEKYHAIICIGCVIQGDTKHNEYINQSVASGLMMLSLSSGVPIIFGVLTPDNIEQARDRAGGTHGNKGVEAAVTALKMANLCKDKMGSKKSIGFSR